MKVVEVKHPLVKHKIGLMREGDISTKRFRELARGCLTSTTFIIISSNRRQKNRGIIQQKPRLVELFDSKTRKRFSFWFFVPAGRIRPEFYPPLLYMTGNTRD
jgi:hypothetical protein